MSNKNEKTTNETFIKAESCTEFDAIHPRFKPEDEAAALRYQRERYYRCEQCDLYFAPTTRGLQVHFRGDMVRHRPCGSCFYCQGEVFEYTINGQSKIHHSCR